MFDRTVNPISTRGADYAHHSTTSPPKFSDLATALHNGFALDLQIVPSFLIGVIRGCSQTVQEEVGR